MYFEEGKEKVEFVERLNAVIIPVQHNVENISYEIFESTAGYTQEYLVVRYRGGAMTVRNCNGNSCYAILEELVKYLDHGYYYEIAGYEEMVNSSDWKKLIF